MSDHKRPLRRATAVLVATGALLAGGAATAVPASAEPDPMTLAQCLERAFKNGESLITATTKCFQAKP
ncbi:hypothetical protein [Bailinhaonella thermotolerans]|uniref:Uncharacterized protein n=1 Tax=Bailinhaonella thermotolerans TaxID=1070861 RepID=A0A3A4ATW9_9ACTN|nr:hypothetical protein [Bailinhaonella thermotolerans]RJL31745.1 hypothetical protein D5H75_18790 [Bailinhaonella thermotolerans]